MAYAKLDKTKFDPGDKPRASDGKQIAANFDAYCGALMAFCGSSIPTGWLACDGASLLRADYADLFAVIGTTYGSADGTHFTVPDLRGRLVVGTGTGSGLTARSRAASGGEESHALAAGEIPAHLHMMNKLTTGSAGPDKSVAGATNATVATEQSTAAEGSGSGHQTMQPWACVNWAIKT